MFPSSDPTIIASHNLTQNSKMTSVGIHSSESSSTRPVGYTDALSATFLLAIKQARTINPAVGILNEDALVGGQPAAKRIQAILSFVHKLEAHLTKQIKLTNDIPTLIAGLALRKGYAAISQITSTSYGQNQAGENHSAPTSSGGTGQNTPGSTVPSRTGNGGTGPSENPMKRAGESRDGDKGNPNKKKKLFNEQQGSDVHRCIVFELDQKLPERNVNHPCGDKQFFTLNQAMYVVFPPARQECLNLCSHCR